MQHYIKKECDNCKLKFNKLYRRYGRFYCHNCFRKTLTPMVQLRGRMSLEKALSKEYNIGVGGSNKNICGTTTFPMVLIGKRFKIVLVEGDEHD